MRPAVGQHLERSRCSSGLEGTISSNLAAPVGWRVQSRAISLLQWAGGYNLERSRCSSGLEGTISSNLAAPVGWRVQSRAISLLQWAGGYNLEQSCRPRVGS
eukprot:scaffold4532_cov74-Isochrysis_galbana.AAC.1